MQQNFRARFLLMLATWDTVPDLPNYGLNGQHLDNLRSIEEELRRSGIELVPVPFFPGERSDPDPAWLEWNRSRYSAAEFARWMERPIGLARDLYNSIEFGEMSGVVVLVPTYNFTGKYEGPLGEFLFHLHPRQVTYLVIGSRVGTQDSDGSMWLGLGQSSRIVRHLIEISHQLPLRGSSLAEGAASTESDVRHAYNDEFAPAYSDADVLAYESPAAAPGPQAAPDTDFPRDVRAPETREPAEAAPAYEPSEAIPASAPASATFEPDESPLPYAPEPEYEPSEPVPAAAPASPASDTDEYTPAGSPAASGTGPGRPPAAPPPPAPDTSEPAARKWRGREPSPPASAPPPSAAPPPPAPQAPDSGRRLTTPGADIRNRQLQDREGGLARRAGWSEVPGAPMIVPPAQYRPSSGADHASSSQPRGAMMTEVRMGVSTPTDVSPGDEFVARFAAYTGEFKDEVQRILKEEAPDSRLRDDLETSQWQKGARVSVKLAAEQVQIANPIQEFVWSGEKQILRFDCKVLPDARGKTLILKFDIAVERFPLIALRPEIRLSTTPQAVVAAPEALIEKRMPRSAFASYASEDRWEVLSRIRSLEIVTGISVFVDNLSIRPGDQWKATLDSEIRGREVFWLFWSRHAQKSPWVDWEWRTALAEKSLAGIQPHPLEPANLAPPPKELSDLQFGAMYEWYITSLREPWFTRNVRRLWDRAKSFW